MKNLFHTIVYTLKQSKGRPVESSYFFNPDKHKPEPPKQEKGKKRSGASQKKTASATEEKTRKLLAHFENYGLIHYKKSKIVPRHPFLIEARLSVAPSGVAFAMGPFDKDVFIPPSRRAGANHRDRVWVELTGVNQERFEGRVVSIIKLFAEKFVAQVKKPHLDGYLIELFDLPDKPPGFLRGEHEALKEGDFLIVEESGESLDIPLPRETRDRKRERRPGRERGTQSYIREVLVYTKENVLQDTGMESDLTRIALKYSIPLDFPTNVMPLKKEIKALHKKGMKDPKRKNLTKLFSCTIDGADTKDFDDALSIEIKKDRRILYVHIADVSYYVQQGSPLDAEALKRGNSYYLKHRVFPMLPPILSEEYCSLKPRSKRLAFTCEMHYDDDANLLEYHFYRSIIHLKKRYTYVAAEKILDKKRSPIRPIWELASQLHKKRIKKGKIELNIPEMEVIMDAHGRIVTMNEKARLLSHKLVEECMLSANTCTGHFLRTNKIPGIHRVHDPMPSASLQKLNTFLKLYGYRHQMRSLNHDEVIKTLQVLQDTKEETIFNYLLLRSFSQAIYSPRAGGHWGLAFKDYTHFTSPIRRYADLVVHRQISATLEGQRTLYSKGDLDFIGSETSRLERIAMEAENATVRLISLRYMADKVGNLFEADFTGFNQNGLFITLKDPRFDGFIPASDFDRYGETNSIDDFTILLAGKKKLYLGQKVEVRLVKIDREKIQLIFSLINVINKNPKDPTMKHKK